MTASCAIESAAPADIADLHAAEITEARGACAHGRQTIIDLWGQVRGADFLAARLRMQLVGFIAFRLQEPDGLYLSDLYVMPAERGHGIGRLLVNSVMKRQVPIALDVAVGNAPARRLYAGLGFAEGAESEGWIPMYWLPSRSHG